MPLYQATAFFEQLGHGWSETYFRDAGGQSDLAVLADFDRTAIWEKRALCCGKQTKLFAQRASFTDVLGDAVLNYINLPGNEAFDSEDANTAALVSCAITNNTKRKNLFMRGVADDLVISGGIVGRGFAPWLNAYNNFSAALITNLYGWLGTDVRTEHAVTNYEPDAVNRLVFTLAAPGIDPPPVGNKVVVTGKALGVGGKSTLNRSFVVIRDANVTVKTAKPTAAFPYPGPGGFLVTRTKTLRVIANCRLQKIVERKAGKVGYISPGRAQARPLG